MKRNVCVWKYHRNTKYCTSSRHKVAMRDAIVRDWKYCPYCGKLIEISQTERK